MRSAFFVFFFLPARCYFCKQFAQLTSIETSIQRKVAEMHEKWFTILEGHYHKFEDMIYNQTSRRRTINDERSRILTTSSGNLSTTEDDCNWLHRIAFYRVRVALWVFTDCNGTIRWKRSGLLASLELVSNTFKFEIDWRVEEDETILRSCICCCCTTQKYVACACSIVF